MKTCASNHIYCASLTKKACEKKRRKKGVVNIVTYQQRHPRVTRGEKRVARRSGHWMVTTNRRRRRRNNSGVGKTGGWGAGVWEEGARGQMAGVAESSLLLLLAPAPLPLIISGQASLLVLGYFCSFSHFSENNSGTNAAHMCLRVRRAPENSAGKVGHASSLQMKAEAGKHRNY